MATTIECPAHHICVPPMPQAKVLPLIFLAGVLIGIMGRPIGRALRGGAKKFQARHPSLAQKTSLDEWALTIAELLDDSLPGEEPLKVDVVAGLIKNHPEIIAEMIASPNVPLFRHELNQANSPERPQK